MREPSPHTEVFGILGEFEKAEALVEAVGKARDAGYRRIEAFSPFPIEALDEALGIEDRRVAWMTLVGGIFGGLLGYGIQVYTNLDFPILIDGRAHTPPEAFMLITFEMTVLFAVLFSIGTMLALNRLPRLHHPLFGVDSFHLASSDKFFLLIYGDDPRFERGAAERFLTGLDCVRVDTVGHTEEPE